MIIWRFRDGRPGHENQTQGLIQALQELRTVTVYDIDILQQTSKLWHWFLKSFPAGNGLPSPNLLLGAGHSTHWPMLVARHSHGGRALVLMNPSLPQRFFDLCVIPEHDNPAASQSVFVSKGVLNKIRPSKLVSNVMTGLILLGGPSKEYGWNIAEIKAQVLSIIYESDCTKWIISASRRTPIETEIALQEIPDVNVTMADATIESSTLMAGASQIWVSEDSVSMVYEALSSGVPTGLLCVPRIKQGRVTRGIDKLIAEQIILPPGSLPSNTGQQPFNEAMRCAQWVDSQWLNS